MHDCIRLKSAIVWLGLVGVSLEISYSKEVSYFNVRVDALELWVIWITSALTIALLMICELEK